MNGSPQKDSCYAPEMLFYYPMWAEVTEVSLWRKGAHPCPHYPSGPHEQPDTVLTKGDRGWSQETPEAEA